jgi:hypothetical protein
MAVARRCYNVQTAVEAKHKRIVAGDATNNPTDQDWLSPLAVEAKEGLGGPFAAVADGGYDHGQEVKQCLQAGITPSIARPITSANQKLGLFSKDDVTYEAATDTSGCPAGEVLSCRFDTVELGRHIRYYATSACRACPLKAQCTRNKGSRRITRPTRDHETTPRARGASLWDDETGLGSGLFPHAWLGQGARRVQLDGFGVSSEAGVEPRGHAPAASQPRLRLAGCAGEHS